MSDTAVEINIDIKVDDLKLEKKSYKLVAHNDNTTPIDYVVHVLMQFCGLSVAESTKVTLQVHHEGIGIVKTSSKRKELTKMKNDCESFIHEHGFTDFKMSVQD